MTKLKEGIYDSSFDPELRRAFEFADQDVAKELIDYSRVKVQKDNILLSGDHIFYTLQGEGPSMGFPAVFCRLHVCNLRCTWCDIPESWNPKTEGFWTESFRLSFEECAEKLEKAWECKDYRARRRVIWTGGEPLIQKRQIEEVCKILDKRNKETTTPEWIYEIETNGTLRPTPYMHDNFQFNVSPKLANSENREGSRVKPAILEELNRCWSTFKFVVTSKQDLDEIERDYLPYIDFEKVIIMPQGVSKEEVNKNAKMVAEYCKEKGFRLMGRLQVDLWGAKRRV